MSSNNDFAHLPLPLFFWGRPKLHGGGKTSTKTKQNALEREKHGDYIKSRTIELSRFWKERRDNRVQNNLPQIAVGIPILLEIDPDSNIDFLRGLGFEIVCDIEEGFIIVATEDADLLALNEKVDEFIANIKAKCNSPAKVYALCEDGDRVKRVLSPGLYSQWNGISADGIYLVDIGVSCSGNIELPLRPDRNEGESDEHYLMREQKWIEKMEAAYNAWDNLKMQREVMIESFVSEYQGEILRYVDGSSNLTELPDSFSARLKITGKCLWDLVYNFPYVFEVSESEKISMGISNGNNCDIIEDARIEAPDPASAIVCVIDSGIQEEHRYLAPAIMSTESTSLIPNDRDTSDHVHGGGHGTRVAGAVLFPQEIPKSGTYKLPCWIRNMRVLDKNNIMPEEIYPPKEIANAVQKYHIDTQHPSKIFNHSIGSRKPCELKHMSPWAAEIDNQCYHNDALFVQASGNIPTAVIAAYWQAGLQYPAYLERELSRIADPAQSLQALTVGSISSIEFETNDFVALGKRGEVASFSRSGPGLWDVLKPEVVEYGGTEVLNKGSNPPLFLTPPEVCPELIRRSPEGPAFAKDQVGTSFSAPKISCIAAQLEKILPSSPALLYRALIAQSARWPISERELSPSERISVLRRIGYGLPDVERATRNDEYRITLITPKLLELGDNEAHVFQVSIPEELSSVGEEYDILLEITLSFAAKPRRTRRRIKGYLSTWLDWCCSRIGESADTFARRIYQTGKVIDDGGDFEWMLGDATNRGIVEGYSRKNGTLQKDWCRVKSNQLSDAFCVAVRGHKGWGGLFKAKYSLTVSFEAVNQDIPIYEPIRSMLEVETTIENHEIEIEMVDTKNQ